MNLINIFNKEIISKVEFGKSKQTDLENTIDSLNLFISHSGIVNLKKFFMTV